MTRLTSLALSVLPKVIEEVITKKPAASATRAASGKAEAEHHPPQYHVRRSARTGCATAPAPPPPAVLRPPTPAAELRVLPRRPQSPTEYIKAYEDACAALRILPSSGVLDQINRPRFDLGFYGLSPAAGRALCARPLQRRSTHHQPRCARSICAFSPETLISWLCCACVCLPPPAVALRNNSIIRVLELPDNGLMAEGLRAILDTLADNTTVTRLNFARNRVSPEPGCVSIERGAGDLSKQFSLLLSLDPLGLGL